MSPDEERAERESSKRYTKQRSFRAPDDEWQAFAEACNIEQRAMSDVLRELMRTYTAKIKRKGAQQ